MVYVNVSGTPEGEERCRRLRLRDLAARDQLAARFRDFCRLMTAQERGEFLECLTMRLKTETGQRAAALRLFGKGIPVRGMIEVLELMESADE